MTKFVTIIRRMDNINIMLDNININAECKSVNTIHANIKQEHKPD